MNTDTTHEGADRSSTARTDAITLARKTLQTAWSQLRSAPFETNTSYRTDGETGELLANLTQDGWDEWSRTETGRNALTVMRSLRTAAADQITRGAYSTEQEGSTITEMMCHWTEIAIPCPIRDDEGLPVLDDRDRPTFEQVPWDAVVFWVKRGIVATMPDGNEIEIWVPLNSRTVARCDDNSPTAVRARDAYNRGFERIGRASSYLFQLEQAALRERVAADPTGYYPDVVANPYAQVSRDELQAARAKRAAATEQEAAEGRAAVIADQVAAGLTIPELKTKLRQLGLRTSGNKRTLTERLAAAIVEENGGHLPLDEEAEQPVAAIEVVSMAEVPEPAYA